MTASIGDTHGTAPTVEEYAGQVAIWAGTAEEGPVGLLMTPTIAMAAGVALIALGRHLAVLPDQAGYTIEAGPLQVGTGTVPALRFTFGGAPLTLELDPVQLAELALHLKAFAEETDAPRPPRPDR